MQTYGKLNVPKEIIIVDNGGSQGYVVFKGNEKMLESAKNWAKDYNRKTGRYECPDSRIHEYENGKFGFEIKCSAEQSSQGGKLSFWNCLVTAEDGRSYLIGINSELLLETLLHNDFSNGVCKSKVYLGRRGGQVGAFTESMPSFSQAQEDEAFRKRKQSDKYGVGQIVYTKTEGREVYLGEVYEKILVYAYESRYRVFRPTVYVALPKKPEVRHAYAFLKKEKGKPEETPYYARIYPNKRKRFFDGGDVLKSKLGNAYEEYLRLEAWKTESDYGSYRQEYEFDKLRYGSDDSPLRLADETKRQIVQYLNFEGWKGEVAFVSEEELRKIEKENGKNRFDR